MLKLYCLTIFAALSFSCSHGQYLSDSSGWINVNDTLMWCWAPKDKKEAPHCVDAFFSGPDSPRTRVSPSSEE